MAAGLAVGIKSAGDLQQAVANISTIKPEIDTSAVFSALDAMSTRVPQSAKQLADGMYNIFSSLDVSVEGATQLVEQFAKGATGAQTDASTFGTAVIGVMNAYKLSVEDATHISDVFFNTVNLGVVSGSELAVNLGMVTQGAKLAGVSLDQLGGLIAGVTKEGGSAAQNINNLNNLFAKIGTKEAQKGFNDMGIATKDAEGNFLSIMTVMGGLKTKLEGMSSGDAATALLKLFPDLQARTAAATIVSQFEFIGNAIETNINSAGSAEDAYKKMSATMNSQMTLLGNSAKATLTEIGNAFLPAITAITGGLVSAFGSPAVQAGMKATIDSLKSFIGLLTEGDPEKRIGMFNQLSTVFGADVAEKIALVTSGIIGIVEALSGNADGIGRLAAGIDGVFGEGTAAKVFGIVDAVMGFVGSLNSAIDQTSSLFGVTVDWGEILKALAIVVGVTIVGAIEVGIAAFLAIKLAILGVTATIEGLQKSWQLATISWTNQMGILATSVTNQLTIITAAFNGLGSFLGSLNLPNPFGPLIDAATNLIRLKNQISGGGGTPAPTGGGEFNGNFGGGLAAGGPVSAFTPYLVGERGPELFVPRSSGQIVPNAGHTFTFGDIVIQGGSGASAGELAGQIVDKLTSALSSGGLVGAS